MRIIDNPKTNTNFPSVYSITNLVLTIFTETNIILSLLTEIRLTNYNNI